MAASRRTMRVEASPVCRVVPLVTPVPPSSTPRLSVPVRALISDSVILFTGMTVYVAAMVEAGKLYRRWDTVAEAAGLGLGWILLIFFYGGYDKKFVGIGAEEFKRVVSASVTLLAVVSTAAYIFLPESPPLRLVIPSLAIGLLLLLVGRWLLRIWLGKQRLSGIYQTTTLVVGERQRSALLIKAFQDDPPAGYSVVAQVEAPTSGSRQPELDRWLADVVDWVHSHGIGAVAIADTGGLDPDLLRKLAWKLEAPRVDLLVSPLLHDVAGPRVSVRPASGLPLLHLDEPVLTGPKRFLKRAMDLTFSIPAAVFLAPVFVAIAVAIKLESRGPVFYVSERVGKSGVAFGCLKFRSMRVGADAERSSVIGAPDDLIIDRYRRDPRITRVGHFLRRWSLDELPQIFNVISGSMSLVGPRPVLPEELDLLADSDLRRHITKPGLTGLWQISGRKEVAWEDRMRMDLYYIEHWSLALDVIIIAKTAKAVLAGRGAF
jgi:exopolysaccharide biosynthesis polyprenyl glycosylphosphotransferase